MSPHTFYDGTIPVTISILKTLSHILHQAEQQRPSTVDTLLHSARLHPSMYPLADQIRIATQYAANLAARLTGREPTTTFPGNPASFAESFARIDTALKALDEADRDTVNAAAESEQLTPMGPEVALPMRNATWAHTVVLPNLYFHLNAAYGILRKEGVEIGKRDYYAGFFPM